MSNPLVPLLDAPVPQSAVQLVEVPRPCDTVVPKQVIDVPKITSTDVIPQRAVLRVLQMAWTNPCPPSTTSSLFTHNNTTTTHNTRTTNQPITPSQYNQPTQPPTQHNTTTNTTPHNTTQHNCRHIIPTVPVSSLLILPAVVFLVVHSATFVRLVRPRLWLKTERLTKHVRIHIGT